jgi:ATP-binding cassette subfamily C protein
MAPEPTIQAPLLDILAKDSFEIRLLGVTVKYGNLAALRGVGLTIPAGACVALVGGSGAGKSTLVDAILGLAPLAEGVIEVNGHVLDALPLKELRRRIGYMAQDPVLFHGTVRENVLWGWAQDTDRAALDALRMAAASDLVKRLPAGLDTVIGNRGSSLSGGERQRLGLARALVGNPGLLILDEATSALDAETEAVVNEALRQIKGKVTILMIAHRLSSVRLADEIHVLDYGAIVESGSWGQLTRDESRFGRLWRLQTESFGE